VIAEYLRYTRKVSIEEIHKIFDDLEIWLNNERWE